MPVDADVPPDLQVGEAQAGKSIIPLGEELGAEVVEEPAQQLTDGQAVFRECA